MGTQESHIKELLVWIEDNLTNPLSLDIVSAKSGYTKWYLQRMFKKQTGLSLASYIRARRLYLAAFALRFTQKSILDISVEYQFDNQQTFSRCFTGGLRLASMRGISSATSCGDWVGTTRCRVCVCASNQPLALSGSSAEVSIDCVV